MDEFMKSLYVLVKEPSAYNSMVDSLFSEVSTSPNFINIIETELPQRWKQLLISKRGQRYTQGNLNWLLLKSYEWAKKVELYSDQFNRVYVLFTNISFIYHRPPIEVFKRIKKRKQNIFFILLYIDMVSRPSSRYSNILREQGVFDLVYSFDEKDAHKNGLIFRRNPYSHLLLKEPIIKRWDLYYCASLKERKTEIENILKAGAEKCQMYMDLILNDENGEIPDSRYSGIVDIHKPGQNIPYDKLIYKTVSANCILDIRLPLQSGLSLRAYEAVVYNKKLLTNNPAILKFEYYNKEYMQYYQTAEQIDWEWVKEKRDISYHYQGDYSPRLLLEDIGERISKIST